MLDKEVVIAIMDAKRRFKSIYAIELPAGQAIHTVVFRPLTYEEFSHISNLAVTSDITDDVIIAATIYPKISSLEENPLLTLSPGIYEQIALTILDTSGFVNKSAFFRVIPEVREQALEIYSQMAIFTCKAFPSLSPDGFASKTLEEMLALVSKAEMSLGVEFPWAAFLNPESQKKTKPSAPQNDAPKGDFSDLPVFTPQQVASMSKAVDQATLERLREKQRAKAEGRLQNREESARKKLLEEWGR